MDKIVVTAERQPDGHPMKKKEDGCGCLIVIVLSALIALITMTGVLYKLWRWLFS